MRSAGILGAVFRALRGSEEGFRVRSTSWEPMVPTAEELARAFPPLAGNASEEQRLGWAVHVQAVREMKRATDRTNARLALFDIGYPHAFSQAIEDLAKDLGAEYNPAGRVALDRALAGEDVYLANDGHWSAHGSYIVALALARSLSGTSVEQ